MIRSTAILAVAGLLAACGQKAEVSAIEPAAGEAAALPATNESADPAELALMAPDDPAEAVIETPKGPMKVMVVMDSSGSMWGQIDGKSKRDIARAAVRQMVAANPDLGAAGLIAYGHRRKSDCADIELLRQPGASVPFPDVVDTLVPVGKTPLTAAVRQAADALKIEETRATVILVTDGIETCNADPCAAGADLETRGIDFTAHVIGFGLSKDEGRQVACLAETTGGMYIEASNAAELSTALASVAGAVESGPPEAATASATITGPGSAEIGATFAVSWTGPDTRTDYIDLVPPGHTATHGELSWAYTQRGNPAEMRAPGDPGTYQLRYVWAAPQGRTVLATEAITITDAAVALVSDPSRQIGQTLTVTWKGPGNNGDYIDIVPRGYTKTTGELTYQYLRSAEPVTLRVPGKPGAYDVRYVAAASDGRSVLRTAPLEVSDAKVDLAFNPSAALGEMLSVDWAGPDGSGDYIDIVPKGHTRTTGEIAYFYTTKGSPSDLKLPGTPGDYEVRYILGAPDGRRVLASAPLTMRDIAVSITPDRTSAVAGSSLSVTWEGPGTTGDYVDLVPRGYTKTTGEKSYAYTRTGNPVTLQMPGEPGEYDLRYMLDTASGRSVKATVPVTLTPATATLNAPASVQRGADFTVTANGPSYSGDYVDLVPKGHTKTSGELDYAPARQGTALTLTAPETAGDYEVRYIMVARGGRHVLAVKPVKVQ